jgi:hypothetical protein
MFAAFARLACFADRRASCGSSWQGVAVYYPPVAANILYKNAVFFNEVLRMLFQPVTEALVPGVCIANQYLKLVLHLFFLCILLLINIYRFITVFKNATFLYLPAHISTTVSSKHKPGEGAPPHFVIFSMHTP